MSTYYKGRVWTCETHNAQVEALLAEGDKTKASKVIREVHPKKGNTCKECARLYEETPSFNR